LGLVIFYNTAFSTSEDITDVKSTFLINAGKELFFSKELSYDSQVACSSCHIPEKGFQDGYERALIRGKVLSRNTLSILNVNRYLNYFWDGRAVSLEKQIEGPLFQKIEIGSSKEIINKLVFSNTLLFNAFNLSKAENTQAFVISALKAYCIDVSTKTTRYNQFLDGNISFTNQELSGMELFFGKANCSNCHSLPNFTDGKFHKVNKYRRKIILQSPGNSTNVSDLKLGYDYGRGNVENGRDALFAFRTPSLFNVSITSPYMHDGSHRTLDEVIDYYNRGGDIKTGPLYRLGLTNKEKKQIISFLLTLSDSNYIKSQ
jgi:cytochrome c peroxidase|tara:strand:- start:60 stop:1010 length:951 start_codon:yes stop_codon:yes gene_type:complete